MTQDNTDALKALGWIEPTTEDIDSLRQIPPEKVKLDLLDVSKCSSCNGRGYFRNHFNMKVNCRRCYGTGNID